MNEGNLARQLSAEERQIVLHSPEAFAGMRRAGRLAGETLDYITPYVQVGVSTEELDRLCHEFILGHGAVPAPLGYRGFPKSICTSINHVVCHGIPSAEKKLADGDIINIDVTVILEGWYGDTSRMFLVGKPKIKAKRLCEVTFEAMWRGIEEVRPGATLGDVGFAIQSFAEKQGFSVVRDFCGHGLGRVFHTAPSVLHYGRPGTGIELRAGHVLHHRADDQRRPPRGADPARRVDRGDAGQVALRAVRALDRRDRDRLRGLHPLAQGLAQAALRGLTPALPEANGGAFVRWSLTGGHAAGTT